MQIRPVNSPVTTTGVSHTDGASRTAAPQAVHFATPTDDVQISNAAQMLNQAASTPGVREQRLQQIKAEIEAGVYDTPEKWAMALDRLAGRVDLSG
jgi:flagellar biosynthesis anti-sigma factor FlgM